MDIDTRFATRLDTVDDVPEPFRTVLKDFPSRESIRLLVYAPGLSTIDEKSSAITSEVIPAEVTPATVLAVTTQGWLVASLEPDGDVGVEKCDFSDTLFFELTSILLSGQLRICFASAGTGKSAIVQFNTVVEGLYREAIELMLDSIDQRPAPAAETDRDAALISETWPIKFSTEAQRYQPKGQRLLAATHWLAIMDAFQRELFPAGALLVAERALVLISQLQSGDPRKFGGIITYFPLARVSDFHLSRQDRFGVLALQVHAMHGGQKLEIMFPSNDESAVSEAIKHASIAKRQTKNS
jgi:hypothetical protein